MLHLDIKSIIASSPLASDDLTASGPSGMTQSCKDILTEQSKDHDVDLAFPLALPTSTLATVIVNPPIEWYVYKASKMSGGKFQFLIGGEGVGVFDLDGWTRGGMWCVEEKMATPAPPMCICRAPSASCTQGSGCTPYLGGTDFT